MGKRKTSADGLASKRPKAQLPSSDLHTRTISTPSSSGSSMRADAGGSTRTLKRRSTDDQVERVIAEKLQGISKSAIESRPLPDGRLLRQKLADDIRSTRGRGRLGTTYWRGLRQYYGKQPALENVKVDKSLPVNDELVHGLEAMSVSNTAMRSAERR